MRQINTRGLFLTNYGLSIHKNLAFIEKQLNPPGENDVVIEVHAAGLNPVDYKIIYGMGTIIMRPSRPFPLGFDLSGIIIGKGVNVRDFNIGDAVYSKVPWNQMGTISTHIIVQSDMVALKPNNINFIEAAGIPLVGCTVFDSFKVAGIKKGTTLLIHGGSGGIGSFAIQYAKYLGAYVYTTTSTQNVEWVKKLGADRVIDYKKEDFRKIIPPIDVVYDTIGGSTARKGLKVVKNGGKIITIAGHHDDETLKKIGVHSLIRFLFRLKGFTLLFRMKRKNVFYKHVWSYPNQSTLNNIRELIETGEIKPIVDKVFPFEEAINGLRYLQKGRAKGKVIISVKDT
jgi:NADPH:quinone reductase-like Zn-dependent oxidoreductase